MERRPMTKPIVIYHANCADGVAAAWCFWKQFGDEYEYHAGAYGKPTPDILDRDVYLVDFSYKHDVTEMICQYANKVVLLDHHKTALEDLWDLTKYENFDMSYATLNHSGARIAWDYVKKQTAHKRKMPGLLPHIEDRDLWHFKLEGTKEYMAAAFSYDTTIETYDKLFSASLKDFKLMKKEGAVLLRQFDKDIKSIVKHNTRMVSFCGYTVPIVNANGKFASEIGNVLAQEHPFAITYCDAKEYTEISLRSVGDFDVSKIAKQNGGGGHKNAAGFKVSINDFRSLELI
jgi:nanoRNase/pAp phosphatase (c-di-AMP/oligoRNAs hydrolase)